MAIVNPQSEKKKQLTSERLTEILDECIQMQCQDGMRYRVQLYALGRKRAYGFFTRKVIESYLRSWNEARVEPLK